MMRIVSDDGDCDTVTKQGIHDLVDAQGDMIAAFMDRLEKSGKDRRKETAGSPQKWIPKGGSFLIESRAG